MSERYIPPPPPYQPSIQHDQKVAEEVHTLEPSKTDSSRNEEWNDAKYPMVLTDKVLKEAALHSISKYPARLDGASFRTRPRPLPSRPVDPPGPQDQDKLDAMGEIKQNHHPIKLRSTASMQFTAPSLGEPMRRPSSAVQPSPSQSYDRRRTLDDRWPVSAYPPIDPGVESHFRCSSHAPLQSAPHGRPLKNTFGMRLSFDPSVAYSDSQANIPTALLSRRDSVASLYASAVSSHLPLDYPTTNGSRHPYACASWSDETPRRGNVNRQSVQSVSSHPLYPRSSVYSLRPKTSSGYETRWASSQTDIERDIYRR